MMDDEKKPEGMGQQPLPGGGPEEKPPEASPPPSPLDELRRELGEAAKTAEGYRDQFLRKAAEFENYKRRSEGEYLNIIRNANEGLITALLPVVEDLTRSLKAGGARTDGEALYRGVELIYQKLMKVLESQGLAPFESAGKPFDVEYHDALLQVARDDVPPGTVVEEIAPGYRLNEKVLRHARVIVSTAAGSESAPAGSPGPGESKESAQS